MEQECMHTPVMKDLDTICADCGEVLCYMEDWLSHRMEQIDRSARSDGLHACDRCYLPKHQGKACQWCAAIAARISSMRHDSEGDTS
jgi:hypothetical protein